MTEAGVRVEGARELRKSLRAAGVEMADLKAVNANVAALVANAASAAAPRGASGRLAASVRGNKAVSTARVVAGYASVPYAGPIHWGWPARNIEPQPFIAETAVALQDQWIALYETGVAEVLAKVEGV